MEGKRTWRLGTCETTANAHYERAGAASKKPISHITRPALCAAGDISQSIAVAASAYLHRRGEPHMIPSWYGLCGFPHLPFDLSCSHPCENLPLWWDFNSTSHIPSGSSSNVFRKSKENNGRGLLGFSFFFLGGGGWLLLLSRYGTNMFSAPKSCQ